MSVKNKAKDRDDSGRIYRKYTGTDPALSLSHTPSWRVNLYMNKPKRRKINRLCKSIVNGKDPFEVIFPVNIPRQSRGL
jgi:hypothetical protein